VPFCVRHNLETIFNYSCADVEEMAAVTRETRESLLRTEESQRQNEVQARLILQQLKRNEEDQRLTREQMQRYRQQDREQRQQNQEKLDRAIQLLGKET